MPKTRINELFILLVIPGFWGPRFLLKFGRPRWRWKMRRKIKIPRLDKWHNGKFISPWKLTYLGSSLKTYLPRGKKNGYLINLMQGFNSMWYIFPFFKLNEHKISEHEICKKKCVSFKKNIEIQMIFLKLIKFFNQNFGMI